MGLREKKKYDTTRLIIQAAKNIFLNKDYEQVTVEEIAIAAQIGTGTVYNYFKSKADLFINVILCGENETEEPQDIFPENMLNTLTPLEAVQKMIDYSFAMIERISKPFWLQIFKAIFSMSEDKTYISGALFGFDASVLNNFQKTFRFYKSTGELPASFDVESATDIIFNLIIGETILALFGSETDFVECKNRALKQARIIFNHKN